MSNLLDVVVVAGSNGSGKSSIYDAIRLIKSVYGGYSDNEIQRWLGEFQVPVNEHNQYDLSKLLYNKSEEFKIECKISLSPEEREYLTSNADDLLAYSSISQRQHQQREGHRRCW